MDYINREGYTRRILRFAGNGNAKVVTGVRRSGKSTIMTMVSDSFGDCNVVRINMEMRRFRPLRDPNAFYDYVAKHEVSVRPNILVVDEIQDVERWEDEIRSLIAEGRWDIYITGSNSKLLSGEFASFLSGRLDTAEVFTLTLSECMRFQEAYGGDDVFGRFLRVGGFPLMWKQNYDEDAALSEISDTLQAIVMRDIVLRRGVRNADLLYRILGYICDNVGSITSINNIYNAISSVDRGVGRDLIYNYVGYLEEACLIYRAEGYNIKGKRILTSGYKFYMADLGFRGVLMDDPIGGIAGTVENSIYLEMRSRGYDVKVGSIAGREVDFVCFKPGARVYIQATVRLSDEAVVEREFGNLRAIDDNHPKYVVTLEHGPLDGDRDGIRCMGLEEFLSAMFRWPLPEHDRLLFRHRIGERGAEERIVFNSVLIDLYIALGELHES